MLRGDDNARIVYLLEVRANLCLHLSPLACATLRILHEPIFSHLLIRRHASRSRCHAYFVHSHAPSLQLCNALTLQIRKEEKHETPRQPPTQPRSLTFKSRAFVFLRGRRCWVFCSFHVPWRGFKSDVLAPLEFLPRYSGIFAALCLAW